MKLMNIPMEERQMTLIRAFKEVSKSPTVNIAIREVFNLLEDIPAVKLIADERDKERRRQRLL